MPFGLGFDQEATVLEEPFQLLAAANGVRREQSFEVEGSLEQHVGGREVDGLRCLSEQPIDGSPLLLRLHFVIAKRLDDVVRAFAPRDEVGEPCHLLLDASESLAAFRQLAVDLAGQLAESLGNGRTSPHFEVTAIRGSVVERGTVDHVLDCDIVLNAADSPWARQVLDQLAYAHLIPVINGGTELRADPETLELVAAKCEVAVAGPGHPCFECADVYSRRTASQAREHPSQRGERAYVKVGDDVPAALRAPSIISTNALVAGMMQLRLKLSR